MRWNLWEVFCRAFKISSWWVCWCSMGCGSERILQLWLGIGVKHVAFYGLWPGMTSLELWLEIENEHEEPWVVAWVGESAGVSVLVVASTKRSRWIALLSGCWRVWLSWDVTDYVRIWELHLALRCMIRSMVFARALSVVADRCGSKTPWDTY